MPGGHGVPARDRTFGLARRDDFLRDTAGDPSRVAAAPQVKMATAPHENAPQASIGPAAPVSHTGFVGARVAHARGPGAGLHRPHRPRGGRPDLAVVPGLTALPAPFAIPWPLAALAFYLGETNVVEVHFLRERHSFSLSELPGIVGPVLPAADRVPRGLPARDRPRPPRRSRPVERQARVQPRPVRPGRRRRPDDLPRHRDPGLAARVRGSGWRRSPRPGRPARSRRRSSRPRSRCPAARRSSGSCPRC